MCRVWSCKRGKAEPLGVSHRVGLPHCPHPVLTPTRVGVALPGQVMLAGSQHVSFLIFKMGLNSSAECKGDVHWAHSRRQAPAGPEGL